MSDQVVISSVIVQVRPERFHDVFRVIDTRPDAEVHASDTAGKLVIVIESGDDAGLRLTIDEISSMAGVLSVSLVFHHTEPAVAAGSPAF